MTFGFGFFLSFTENVVLTHKSQFPIYHFQVSIPQTPSFLACSLKALEGKMKWVVPLLFGV